VPPLTLENASALVPGGVTAAAIEKERKAMQAQAKAAPPQTLKVRVLRAFQDHERKVRQKDETVELPRLFALEMKAANKAEIIPEPAPAAPAPAAKEDRSLFASGKKEK
jgi:hypothetical protein